MVAVLHIKSAHNYKATCVIRHLLSTKRAHDVVKPKLRTNISDNIVILQYSLNIMTNLQTMSLCFYGLQVYGTFPSYIDVLFPLSLRRLLPGQLGMNNPETQETLDTRHRTKTKKATTKNTTQKTKMMSNTDPVKKQGANAGAREG
jgi:hypothetical protein